MSVSLLPISVASYEPHQLHRTSRVWDQTNCSVDVWVEVLHALHLEPLAATAFSVATDFEGDQWQFYKFPPEDLWTAYRIDVHEMNPWRSVLAHVVEHLRGGRLMTVEVDSWYLPDTAGVSYRSDHVKSTIVANEVDVARRAMSYFHNSGYHRLSGDDFDGVFGVGHHPEAVPMRPYTEIIRLDRLITLDGQELTNVSRGFLENHLRRRPQDNPVRRMAERVTADLPWLQETPEAFYDYAFVTVRQCGAAADTASAFCTWLASRAPDLRDSLLGSARHWSALASGAKTQQLKLARAARGRTASLAEGWDEMARAWTQAQDQLNHVIGAG